jgi:hypothetical protein
MDVSAFLGAYRADGHGRPAHDPAMMLALLLYAYRKGQRSSRVIEREAKRRLDEKRAADAGPIPRSRPERLSQSKRHLEEDLAVECAANAAYEAYRARGVMKDGRRVGPSPKPYKPPDTPAGKGQLERPRLAQREDAAWIHAGL